MPSLDDIAAAALVEAGYSPGARLTASDVLAVARAVRDACADAADAVAQQYRPLLERGVIDRQAQACQNGAMSAAAAVRGIE